MKLIYICSGQKIKNAFVLLEGEELGGSLGRLGYDGWQDAFVDGEEALVRNRFAEAVSYRGVDNGGALLLHLDSGLDNVERVHDADLHEASCSAGCDLHQTVLPVRYWRGT